MTAIDQAATSHDDPARVAELIRQRNGIWCTSTGVGGTITVVLCSLGYQAVLGEQPPVVIIAALISTLTLIAGYGLHERANRPHRDAMRKAGATMGDVARILKVVTDVQQRIAALEVAYQETPTYKQGFLDCMLTLGRQAPEGHEST